LPVAHDTRRAVDEAIGAGFRHIVLGLASPYPAGVVRLVADEVIAGSGRAEP
jgi:hypothetical protein